MPGLVPGIHALDKELDVDGRDIGERSDAVLRTAKPGHDSRARGENMKLASYIAGGKECYGVVSGDGVITMRGHASLRHALAAGALEGMRTAAATAKPDFKL